PDRATGVDEPLDFSEPLNLSFAPPDLQRFPCLRLAREAMHSEGIAPTVFNAANEIAVDAFLRNRIGFLGIPAIIEATLNDTQHRDPKNIEEVLATDSEARKLALEKLRNQLH
ncbi:MAG: 1-deoxy-D-xylulose-5-phosphate reductoisomerase, partial [Opitutae bacterium]|nr:1-deoxy-D-xylulose-5-phosphate reductoisomerase [Opitutae bacterium]